MTALYTLDAATVAEIARLGAIAASERDTSIALWRAEDALAGLRAEETRWLVLCDDLPRELAVNLSVAEDAVRELQAAYDAFADAYGAGELCTCDQCW